MTQAAAPVGYSASGGTWGTHIVDDTTLYKTGNSSVKFTGASVQSNLQQAVSVPCAPGDLLRVSGWVRCASIAAGNNAMLWIQWRDAADAYVSNSFIINTELDAADTWQFVADVVTAPAGAYYWRVNFGVEASAADTNWDSVFVERARYMSSAYMTDPYALTADIATGIVEFTSEHYDFGGCFDVSTPYDYTAPEHDVYLVTLRGVLYTDEFDSDETITIKLYKNDAAAQDLTYLSLTHATVIAPSTYALFHVNVSTTILLDAGDTINIRASTGNSETVYVHEGSGSEGAVFAVTKLNL